MNNRSRYKACFLIDNQTILELSDNNKDKLTARSVRFLESVFNDATCSIIDTETNNSVLKLKRNALE